MILRHLSISGFRNIERAELDLSDGVTLFFGKNAQGKTNLLEAVHYLATGRSFRTRIDRECLAWGSDTDAVARVEGRIERSETNHDLAVSLTDRAKFAWCDGKSLPRLGDLLGRIVVVLFTPGDIEIAAGSPAARRRFLDMALSQISSAYLQALQGYSQALRERNAALRSPGSWFSSAAKDALDPWAALLVQHGVEVVLRRREALEELAVVLGELYGEIAPGDAALSLEYRCGAGVGPGDDREAALAGFESKLAEAAERERLRAQTLVGPHRDDFGLKIGGREVRDFGSQGQQRSVALALRLAELRWIADITGETPLLLVDDLGAELDRDRRGRLLALFRAGAQTLATTAGDPDEIGRMLGADRAIEVSGGKCQG